MWGKGGERKGETSTNYSMKAAVRREVDLGERRAHQVQAENMKNLELRQVYPSRFTLQALNLQ